VWLGIAADAVSRASAFVRNQARKSPGTVPYQATRLAEVSVKLQAMRNNVAGQAAEFDDMMQLPDGMERLLTIGWALKMNNLKVGASEMVPRIVHEALQIVGIGGYKNDSPFSMGRHYRDALSAALMISNDRIFSKTASLLLVYKDE
jgi:acyl-CoA dehydrogenase